MNEMIDPHTRDRAASPRTTEKEEVALYSTKKCLEALCLELSYPLFHSDV